MDRQTMSDDAAILPETGERMVPELSAARIYWEHVERYKFACRHVVGKRVLDIACGEGYGTAALLKAGASCVIGVDISLEVCEHARAKYGLDFRQGDAMTIPLEDASVDVVVSFETIEHVTDPLAFLRECARVLAPGGTLIVSTPNRPVYSPESKHNPFHQREFDRAEFLDLLKPHFGVTHLYGQTLKAAPWWNWQSLSAEESFWRRIRGYWRLTSWLCPAVRSDMPPGLRANVCQAILGSNPPSVRLVNPYEVRKASRFEPYYWIAVSSVG